MKQLFTLLAITLFGAATWSCSYDDDDLWKEIDGLKTQLAELNKEVSALQTLVDALRQSKTISDVTQTDTGYTITFNDNTSVSIADGKNGTNAPEVGIDLFEGVPLTILQKRAQKVAALSVALRPQKLLFGVSRSGGLCRRSSFRHISFLLVQFSKLPS